MAKKVNPASPGSRFSPTKQLDQLLARGQTGEAVELTKQWMNGTPTPEHAQLRKRAFLAHGAKLAEQDNFRLAHAFLTEAEALGETDPTWWEKLAEFRAKIGDWNKALSLLGNVPDAAAPDRILGHIVDRALSQGASGRNSLPQDQVAGFQVILDAFQCYERNQDEKVRELLQGIGLRSPYLDWKMMLRGLLAYAANDNPRAIENWQRLHPDRLPWQLVATFRFGIDSAFRKSLPADQVDRYRATQDQLTGGTVSSLRKVQRAMQSEEGLPEALRLSYTVAQDLKRSHPELAQKLANYFYWSIVQFGAQEDIRLFQKSFGALKDDPQFHRMEAMALEKRMQFATANKHWGEYEKWIASHSERWPSEQANFARAILWEMMGANAEEHENSELEPPGDFFSFFENINKPPKKPTPLKPSAEECYRRSFELAPQSQNAVAKLFSLLVENKRYQEAEVLSKDLLERFPHEVQMLASIAELYHMMGRSQEAYECMKKALAGNPLDKVLGGSTARMGLFWGRELAIQGDFEGARAIFQERWPTMPERLRTAYYCLWAACELKTDNPSRAEELLKDAAKSPHQSIAIAYQMMVELGRLKYPKKLLIPYQKSFDAACKGILPLTEIIPAAFAVEQYRREAKPYHGLVTHEKKISGVLKKAITGKPDEQDLATCGLLLAGLKMWTLLRDCAQQGLRRFPENPYFPFLLGEYQLSRKNWRGYIVAQHFQQALELSDAEPEKYSVIRKMIEEYREDYPELDNAMAGGIFPRFPFPFPFPF